MRLNTRIAATLLAALAPFGAGAADVVGAPSAERLPANPKLSSEFAAVVDALRAAPTLAHRQAVVGKKFEERMEPIAILDGPLADRIEAYVWLDGWNDDFLAQLEAAGAEILAEDPERFLVQAWIPLDRAESIAALDGVRQIRRPNYATTTAGSRQTEGDAILNGPLVRNIGRVDGNGVRVGVLSVGLFTESLAATAAEQGVNNDFRVFTGNIPGNTSSADGPTFGFFGAVQITPSSFSFHLPVDGSFTQPSTMEGAAILETIHDIAPGASLYYADARTDLLLQAGRDWLLARGVEVIVDNTVFIGAGRFDGTSTISRRAQEIARTRNTAYISSVGNFTPPPTSTTSTTTLSVRAGRFPLFVNGVFSPSPAATSKNHNFGYDILSSGTRDETLFVSPQNGVLDVALVWDDVWDDKNPRATDDIDIFLLPAGSSDLNNPLAVANNLQNNSGLPYERLTYFGGTTGNIVLHRKSNSDNSRRLFSLMIIQGRVDGEDTRYLTHGVPVNNADALPPVITCGGIDFRTGTATIEDATVPGRWPGPGHTTSGAFTKWFQGHTYPAVVSYTNTSNLSTGFLTGSSGAAAHIGGFVALMRHAYREVPGHQYYDILRDTRLGETNPFPNATRLIARDLEGYINVPEYLRTNGYDTFANTAEMLASAETRARAIVSTTSTEEWASSQPVRGFDYPRFDVSTHGLAVSPNGSSNCYGYWESDVLNFVDLTGDASALRSDRIYEVKARVGTTETDPNRVPDFRLRLTTALGDESAMVVVAGLDPQADNTPSSVSGREYTMYFRPTSDKVARNGMRFAFELISFDPKDNPDATLFLQDLNVRELKLPEQ